jgi:plastocyanin
MQNPLRKRTMVIIAVGIIVIAAVLSISQKDTIRALIASQSTPTDKPIFVPEGGGHKEYEEPNSKEKHVLVTIQKGKFVPENLTVEVGSTVVFENYDKTPHVLRSDNYTSDDKQSFDTGKLLYEKEVDAVVYTMPGTYTYHCTLHPEMKGMITVVEE